MRLINYRLSYFMKLFSLVVLFDNSYASLLPDIGKSRDNDAIFCKLCFILSVQNISFHKKYPWTNFEEINKWRTDNIYKHYK